MRTHNFKLILPLFALTSIVAGCASFGKFKEYGSDFPARFEEMFPIPMNENLQLVELGSREQAEFLTEMGQSIDIRLLVINLSEQDICFPTGFNAQIFMYHEETNQWLEIEDQLIYANEKDIIVKPLDKETGLKNSHSFSLYPDLSDLEPPVELRIVIVGNICEEGTITDEKVGAYLDVIFPPQ